MQTIVSKKLARKGEGMSVAEMHVNTCDKNGQALDTVLLLTTDVRRFSGHKSFFSAGPFQGGQVVCADEKEVSYASLPTCTQGAMAQRQRV